MSIEFQSSEEVGPPVAGDPPRGWRLVDPSDWDDWRWHQKHRIRSANALDRAVGLDPGDSDAIAACADQFRMSITPYYASLIDPADPKCPIRLQAVPRSAELETHGFELEDPLAEEAHMAAPGVTHRYPDRVLFYVTHNCPVYCRHCTRKRKVSDPASTSSTDDLDAGLAYIAGNPNVRDVLVSGGDPLSLSDARLGAILDRLSDVPHVDVIRLGTRNPVTLPQRITAALCEVLRRVRPLYLHTHFNHRARVHRTRGVERWRCSRTLAASWVIRWCS